MIDTHNQFAHAVVFYHANCTDGFGSAWAFHRLAEQLFKKTEYRPVSHGNPPPTVGLDKDTSVYILDFSYPREILATLAAQVKRILILDHHKTAREALSLWDDRPENVHIIFDMDRSGAGMTWDFFSEVGSYRPRLIRYIEDRDLWRFHLEKSVEVNAPILVLRYDFAEFDKMHDRLEADINGVAAIGEALVQQKDRYVEEIVSISRKCSFETPEGWISGLCSNCTYQFASDVGGKLAEKSGTFGATYFTNESGDTIWSLRSRGEFDVSAIAKQFGGGGHKNAAGFKLFASKEVEKDGVNVWLLHPESESGGG